MKTLALSFVTNIIDAFLPEWYKPICPEKQLPGAGKNTRMDLLSGYEKEAFDGAKWI